jgi:hypothetical protein
VADDDLVVADEDFLHEKAQHASAFDYIERIDGRTQAVEEARHGFGETQTNFLLLRLVFGTKYASKLEFSRSTSDTSKHGRKNRGNATEIGRLWMHPNKKSCRTPF